MQDNKKIAVIIPCYKVANHITMVIADIPEFVDFIITVDDACPQQSGKIITALNNDKVYLISHQHNQGVGASVVSGYKKALALNADIFVKIDGDGQMNGDDLALLLPPLINDKADYTKGNRFNDFKALKKMPKLRLFGNSILSFVVKIASGYWNILDPTNGFTAINKETISKINLDTIEKRYFFEIDMLIKLNISNCVVKDIAISAKYADEKSNLSIINTLISFPFKITKGLANRIFYQYFIFNFNMASIYLLLGFPLLVFGSSYGVYRLLLAIYQQTENTAGTIMLAALPIILGTQFLLQAISIDISNIPKK